MIVPAMVATRTYIKPGSSCSPVSALGARLAIVFAISVSFRKKNVRPEFKYFSATNVESYSHKRTFRICFSRRSVGVGVEASGTEGGVFVRGSEIPCWYFGMVFGCEGEAYIGFF